MVLRSVELRVRGVIDSGILALAASARRRGCRELLAEAVDGVSRDVGSEELAALCCRGKIFGL